MEKGNSKRSESKGTASKRKETTSDKKRISRKSQNSDTSKRDSERGSDKNNRFDKKRERTYDNEKKGDGHKRERSSYEDNRTSSSRNTNDRSRNSRYNREDIDNKTTRRKRFGEEGKGDYRPSRGNFEKTHNQNNQDDSRDNYRSNERNDGRRYPKDDDLGALERRDRRSSRTDSTHERRPSRYDGGRDGFRSNDRIDRQKSYRRDESDQGEKKNYRTSRTNSDEQSNTNRFHRNEGEPRFDRKEERKPYRSFDRDNDNYKSDRRDNRGRSENDRYSDAHSSYNKPSRYSKSRKKNEQEEHSSDGSVRLNKYISNAGICSRREADVLIASGAVSVNGEIITEMGFKVRPTDVVNYGGERLASERKKYLLLNKPKGYITTTDDPQDRKTVMNLIGNACKERIYPVGRLDRNTTGLLLFTNDGEMAKKLTHPSYGAEKIYHVELDKPLTKRDMQQILDGVELEDGTIKADDVQYVGTGDDKKIVGIQLHSGKNRIVRRIFESLGYEIFRLDRVVFAGLNKKDLPRGHWRFLTEKELSFLKML